MEFVQSNLLSDNIFNISKSVEDLHQASSGLDSRNTPELPCGYLLTNSDHGYPLNESEPSQETLSMLPPRILNHRGSFGNPYQVEEPPKVIMKSKKRKKSSKVRKARSKYKIYERQMKWLDEKNKKNEILRQQQYKELRSPSRDSSVKSRGMRFGSPARSGARSGGRSPARSTSRVSNSFCKSTRSNSSKKKKTKTDKTFCDFLIRNEIWQQNKQRKIQENTTRLRSLEKMNMKKAKVSRRSRSARKQ